MKGSYTSFSLQILYQFFLHFSASYISFFHVFWLCLSAFVCGLLVSLRYLLSSHSSVMYADGNMSYAVRLLLILTWGYVV